MTLPLSIIIPTYNEEKYLPKLLESIRKQTAQPSEIIVADNKSTDKTQEIAKRHGCVVTQGGNHPGIGRNNGVKVAQQPYLVFFDADVILPSDFLEKNFQEFRERKLGVASTLADPDTEKKLYHLVSNINNYYFLLTETFLCNAFGFSLFSTREIHDKINGFDESIKIAEDQDYARRANKISRYRMLKSRRIIVSMRRYQEEGKIRLVLKYLVVFAHTTFLGPIKHKKIPYSFKHRY